MGVRREVPSFLAHCPAHHRSQRHFPWNVDRRQNSHHILSPSLQSKLERPILCVSMSSTANNAPKIPWRKHLRRPPSFINPGHEIKFEERAQVYVVLTKNAKNSSQGYEPGVQYQGILALSSPPNTLYPRSKLIYYSIISMYVEKPSAKEHEGGTIFILNIRLGSRHDT